MTHTRHNVNRRILIVGLWFSCDGLRQCGPNLPHTKPHFFSLVLVLWNRFQEEALKYRVCSLACLGGRLESIVPTASSTGGGLWELTLFPLQQDWVKAPSQSMSRWKVMAKVIVMEQTSAIDYWLWKQDREFNVSRQRDNLHLSWQQKSAAYTRMLDMLTLIHYFQIV